MPAGAYPDLIGARMASRLKLVMPVEHKARRSGAFFGRRKGHRLRPHQAELFEHLIAVAPLFGLRLFQSPSSGGELPAVDAAPAAD